MLSRSQVRLLKGLHRRKMRESEGLFLAEGVRVVEELLASRIVPRLVVISSSLEDTPRGARLRTLLEARSDVLEVSDRELAELSATETPQGVLVAAEAPRQGLGGMEPGADGVVLVLDAVQDPGNVGTLVRTAAAFGVDAVVTLAGTVDAWNPKVVRASAGAVFRLVPVACGWEALRAWLGTHRFGVYGADASGDAVEAMALPARRALVVGNEGTGLSQDVSVALDGRIAVPMTGAVESLNVAVAAGILLYVLTSSKGARR